MKNLHGVVLPKQKKIKQLLFMSGSSLSYV
jgi:hypothetical protein